MQALLKFARKNKYLLLIIFVSVLPVIPFFAKGGLLHTHDGLVHLPRLAAYFKALSDGNFPVRYAGYLNYGYGLPLFNFIYQFPYMVGSVFLFLGFGLVNSFKISLTLSFILSGVFMYLFGKEYFEDERKGILVALFYQFAPFRMVEVLVRGSYGEVYTYAFIPLVFLGLLKIQKGNISKGFILSSLATSLLVISHNSVSLLYFGVAFLYLIFTTKKIKTFLISVFSLIYGLLISSFYWVPAIYEHKYTYGNLFMEKLYQEHFVPIQNFFIPNLTNNPALLTEGIATYIGLFQTLGLVLALILIFRRKIEDRKTRRIFYLGLVLFLISLFFMTRTSSFIWAMPQADLLRQFQFPWRFLSIVVVGLSFLAVSLPIFDRRFREKYAFAGLIIFIVLSTAFYWKASLGYKKIDENYYMNFPLNTTYYGETDLIWSAGPAKSYPKEKIEVISGSGQIYNLEVKNQSGVFSTESEEKMTLLSNTQYYPGWRAYVDGKETPIQFQDPNHRGLLVFDVPKGSHTVKLIFEETKLRYVVDSISLVTFVMLIPAVFFIRKKWS